MIAFLRHLERAGFDGAPRPIGSGFADDGREAMTFVEGSSPHPRAWSEEGAAAVGALLRRAHDAGRDFRPGPGARWQDWHGRDLPGDDPIIGHCDPGPWNVIARDGQPVALIDWEFAGPVDAVWDLAHACWLNAHLHDEDVAGLSGLPSATERTRHAALVLDGYGLPAARRRGIVAKMISLAVYDARAEAVEHDVTPTTTSAVAPDGYPVLRAVTWRARSAAWMLRHQRVLERALERSP